MGMTKLILPGSYDFGEANSQIIKIASSGLTGSDLGAFIKRAGHKMADAMRKLSFAPGEVPIHLIAIGSTEYYGPNRNGDGFTETCCKKYHDTFVKHARWYRNHQNKDPEKSYGIVKHSAYNDSMHRLELIVALNGTKEAAIRNNGLVAARELSMIEAGKDDWGVSMACGKAGTLIYTNVGYKTIEQILPGDMVLTHAGRFCAVGNRSVRRATEIIQIMPRYYGRQVLEFTPNHEFLVCRWSDIPKEAYKAIPASWWFRKKHRDQLHNYARWLPCGELHENDLLLMPIRRGPNLKTMSVADARLLGYYTAEGSLISPGDSSSRGVCFTCHINDDLPKEIDSIIPPNVRVNRNQHSASALAVNLTAYSHDLFDACSAVGRGVENKRIPTAIWDATAAIKLNYIGAWFNGDGWQDVKGLHWSTCSRTLSLELQMLLASIGIPASVYRIDHTSDLPHGIPREVPGIEYTVNVSNHFCADFTSGRSKARDWPVYTEKTTVFITGNYLAVPVGSVTHKNADCDVYNFAVHDDESYTAFGLAVHNCKVAYDVCSGCGNKAATRADYCTAKTCKYGGVKDNMLKIADDGHIQYVDNPHPTWFDISDVSDTRPADRIAFVLGPMQKAASQRILSGADLAAEFDVSPPYELAIADVSDRRIREQIKLAYILADKEQKLLHRMVKVAESVVSETFQVTQPLPYSRVYGVEGIGRDAKKCGMALKAMAREKIAMTLPDFLQFTTTCNQQQAQQLAQEIQPHLHSVFTHMCEDTEKLAEDLKKNPFRPSDYEPTIEWEKWARENRASGSLDLECVQRRLFRDAIRGVQPHRLNIPDATNLVKSAAHENLARVYGLYKLAFLYALKDSEHFQLTSDLVVRQNLVS